MTFVHSGRMEIEQVKNGRSRNIEVKQSKNGEPELTNYNCTVRVPKRYAFEALDDKIMRAREIARILAPIAAREAEKEQQAKEAESYQAPRQLVPIYSSVSKGC